MNSKPYSQYDNLGEYTRTVGMFCSLLFRNGFCKPEQIDQILSSSRIFRSIEQKHNPLLATSNEQVWMALLLEEPSFSALFDDEARQKLLRLNETDELQFDWLSMWSGDVIAQLAMYYDVPMSEIVSSMQFEEFLKFSVANHTQAEERMYAIFAEHSDGKFPLPHSWAANTLDGEICLVDGELANRLVQCLGYRTYMRTANTQSARMGLAREVCWVASEQSISTTPAPMLRSRSLTKIRLLPTVSQKANAHQASSTSCRFRIRWGHGTSTKCGL